MLVFMSAQNVRWWNTYLTCICMKLYCTKNTASYKGSPNGNKMKIGIERGKYVSGLSVMSEKDLTGRSVETKKWWQFLATQDSFNALILAFQESICGIYRLHGGQPVAIARVCSLFNTWETIIISLQWWRQTRNHTHVTHYFHAQPYLLGIVITSQSNSDGTALIFFINRVNRSW